MRRGIACAAAVLAILGVALLPGPVDAANFGVHAGFAEDARADPYFVAGALLADLDHFLPPGEPQTDSLDFARGVVARAWGGSHRAWALARGWLEHLDQDARFVQAVAAVVAAYPAYTTTDVRLGFDYWTVTKHPFSADFAFLLGDAEVHGIVAGGLAATDAAGVRDATDRLLYSQDLAAPGLFLQLDAARLFGVLNPQTVRDLEPFFDAYYAATTAGWRDPFPRVDALLLRIHRCVRWLPPGDRAVLEPIVLDARALAWARPAGWLDAVRADLDALTRSGAGMTGPAQLAGDLASQVRGALEPPA